MCIPVVSTAPVMLKPEREREAGRRGRRKEGEEWRNGGRGKERGERKREGEGEGGRKREGKRKERAEEEGRPQQP